MKTGIAEKRAYEETMKISQLFGSWTALVLGILLGLTACISDAAL